MGSLQVNEAGYRIGESHPRATIPDHLVRAARLLREEQGLTYAEIASQLRILSVRTIQGICQYRKRADVPTCEPAEMRHGHWRRGKRSRR